MEICPGQHWAAPNVLVLPVRSAHYQDITAIHQGVTLSFLMSDVSLVTGPALGDAKVWISQSRTLHGQCHGCSGRVVPATSLSQGCCHCRGHVTACMGEGSSSPSEEDSMNLHEPAMTDGCFPLLARKGKCCLEYFDVLEMSHRNSFFCIIRSPFHIEKITNIRIAIFSFQATICRVLVTCREAGKHLTTLCYKKVKLKSMNLLVWQSWN